MAEISTNPLGRTQRTGQGTAFVYKPLSNVNPLDRLYNTVLKQQQNKVKQKIEGDKIRIEAGKDLRSQTLKVFDKLRPADIPLAQQYIEEIFKEVENAPNFSDPMSPDFQKVQEKLAQINVFANSSEAFKKSEDNSSNKWNTRPDEFDPKSKELLDLLRTKTTLEVANDPVLQSYLTLNPRKLSIGEVVSDNKLLTPIKDAVKFYNSVQNDKALRDKFQKSLDDDIFPMAKIDMVNELLKLQEQGRLDPNLTNDDIIKAVDDKLNVYKKQIGYNQNKDQDQQLAQDKFAFDKEYKKALLAQGWQRIKNAQKEPQQTNVVEMLTGAINGEKTTNKAIKDIPTGDILGYNSKDEPIYAIYGYMQKDGNDIIVEVKDPRTNEVIRKERTNILDNNGIFSAGNSNLYKNVQSYAIKNNFSYGGTDTKANIQVKNQAPTTKGKVSTKQTTPPAPKNNTTTSNQIPNMSVAEWNKKWSSLKKGEKLVGLDGKTYIKK